MRQKSVLRLVLEPIVLAIALAALARAFIQIYAIPSASMVPTYRPGDHIVVTPYRPPDRPERGDIVVFRAPNGEGFVVKRIIAAPGDLIETREGRVALRGRTIAEPYAQHAEAGGAIAPQIVPTDCYFVMGDNRAESQDSRHWGPLPRQLIVGRARMVLWSSGGRSSTTEALASIAR